MEENNNNFFEDNNTIIELSPVSEDTLFDEKPNSGAFFDETNESLVVKPKGKKKTKGQRKPLNKKTKIVLLSVCVGIIALALVGLILYFVLFKDKEEKPEEEKPVVIIEKDNYIYENGTLKLLDANDNVIGTYTCINGSAEECYVAPFDNEDNFDVPQYVYEDGSEIVSRSQIYFDNYVFIYDDGKIMLFDIAKQETVGDFKLIKKGLGEKKLFAVRNLSNDYGVIEITSEGVNTLVDYKYDYIGILNSDETFVVKDSIHSYLINSKGKAISAKVVGDIKSFNEKYIACLNEGYKLYDYSGDLVFDETYEFIDLSFANIMLVNDKKVYFYTNELVKLNEEGYKLKNNYYVPRHIYRKTNNDFKETQKAYGITVINGIITFEITDSITKTINVNEGLVNTKYDYVNYFDGVLYIYSDKEKTELAGTYYCENKNSVASKDDEYQSCFIATDSSILESKEENSYIPIFNDNYAFIKDSSAGSTIILYDLANEKDVAKYSQVETNLGLSNVSYITSINALIVAKNTSGAYGVITFSADGPESIIKFSENGQSTSKISKLSDKYFVVVRNKTNYLYTKQGEMITSSEFEIIDYTNEYLIVKNNQKFMIYKDGTILADSLDYYKLFKDYYVGIKSGKLNVYSYSASNKALLVNSLSVNNNNYENSYAINKTDKNIIITIINNDGSKNEYKFNLDWSEVIPTPAEPPVSEEEPVVTPENPEEGGKENEEE